MGHVFAFIHGIRAASLSYMHRCTHACTNNRRIPCIARLPLAHTATGFPPHVQAVLHPAAYQLFSAGIGHQLAITVPLCLSKECGA